MILEMSLFKCDNGVAVDGETNDVIKTAGEKFVMAHQISRIIPTHKPSN